MGFAGCEDEGGAAGTRFRSPLILALEIGGGAATAVLGAGLLAAAIVLTGHSAPWMAVGAGILVGNGVRTFGKDDGVPWGILGAALSLACCLAGNVLANGVALPSDGSVPPPEAIFRHGPGAASAMIRNALRPVCLASYAVAVAIGYVVVREERVGESFGRLAARYRR